MDDEPQQTVDDKNIDKAHVGRKVFVGSNENHLLKFALDGKAILHFACTELAISYVLY